MNSLPILYTFRRCPYCIRARLSLAKANINCIIREIVLRDKPQEMLQISPKGTVPILLLPNKKVIDESLDIMKWAIDTENFDLSLIHINDTEFKSHLNGYKWPEKHLGKTQVEHRTYGESFLQKLEHLLENSAYLDGKSISYTDFAILPFIRQFRLVNKEWFDSSPYKNLIHWEKEVRKSKFFESIMPKYEIWNPQKPSKDCYLLSNSLSFDA